MLAPYARRLSTVSIGFAVRTPAAHLVPHACNACEEPLPRIPRHMAAMHVKSPSALASPYRRRAHVHLLEELHEGTLDDCSLHVGEALLCLVGVP